MASSSNPSSSSSFTRGMTHDIFLSFRGEDTRNTFVDHLYAALVQKGIQAFKDDQMLGGGKPISQALLKAIKESKFAIVVFSKNYANSSWCLEELSEIMECHDRKELKVLPVFYHVDPSDVRKQKGNFAIDVQVHQQNKLDPADVCGQKRDFTTAFETQEDKCREEIDKVNKWKKALTAAASISGYHISTVSGGESATINKIVQEILVSIQPRSRDKNLIGIESHLRKLNSLLSMKETEVVRIIGIHGMGGIGKTTIARALFRRIACMFEGSSFVSNVRENSLSNRDICVLQEKILKDVLLAHHGFTIQDPEDGADMIQERFCNKKVLLVLDDVDNHKQLEFLAASHVLFGAGSRIIITTRDEHMMSDTKIVKYKPTLLRKDQALQLFSRHAFKKNSPPLEFKDLSDRAICYTGRLPLALKVLGSFFHGREAYVLKSALDRLTETPNTEIFTTLKLSFDGLEEFEKKIFLDIACFFKDEKVDDVTRVLDSFGFHAVVGIRILIEKSLIIVSKNRLRMHDLIQEMGWQLVNEIAPNSRLRKEEEILDLIKKNMNFELIEAIVLSWKTTDVGLNMSIDVFKKMKNLRLLQIYGKFSFHKPTILPDQLRWLCWRCYPFSSLPASKICKLVGLEMKQGKIEHLWTGQKIMPKLKFIDLRESKCLTRFPDVSGAPNIERLILSNCHNLVEVDESLGFLKRLIYLDMSNCWKLKCLPSRIEMDSLETLILDNCMSLEGLPDSICELKCLMSISLKYCIRLDKLPNKFGNMKNLQELNLSGRSFKFHYLKNMCSLRKLDLSFIAISDQDFPMNLYGFSSLEELILCHNFKLNQLPASITHISHLKHLDLSYCCSLKSVNGLPSRIQVLDAKNCKALEVLDELSEEYEWLHMINFSGSTRLFKDKRSERYLDKMLEQSFFKKWAARDSCLSIAFCGNKIPSWLKEQQGTKIALKLPFKWRTEIMGFAICCTSRLVLNHLPCISFRFENGGTWGPVMEVDPLNASATTASDYNVWIGYVPLSLFKNMHHDDDDDDDDDDYSECEDWSHIIESNLIIEVTTYSGSVVKCGAEVVYREVESTQQIIKPLISSSFYYWNWNTECGWSRNTFMCK